MRRFIALCLATAVTLAALPVYPQSGTATLSAAEEEKRAKLFKEGKALADAELWAEAAKKFRQVVAMRSAPKALIALGVAEEKQGHLLAALSVFKQAREDAADKTLTDELKLVNTALESLKQRIPRLIFLPAAALSDASVTIDGESAKPDGDSYLVDPGKHTVVITSTSSGVFETAVTLAEGDKRTLEVVYGSATPTATSITPPPDKPSIAPPTGAVVVGAAGVVLVGVGAALYGTGTSDYNDAIVACKDSFCPIDNRDRGNAARTRIIVGDVFMIAGGAALAGGVLWWIVNAAGKKKEPPASVYIAPTFGGLSVGGRF
ncbi:MAG: tetratricopeptide repeat protein [Polyangiaceae bacterium]|nr:tetratricopeptide repeat protein [Polyangiaceae bacterium]